MRSGIMASIFLHSAVIVIGIFGLPEIRSTPKIDNVPMVIEIVPLNLKTNLSGNAKIKKNVSKKTKKLITKKNSKQIKKKPKKIANKNSISTPPANMQEEPKLIIPKTQRIKLKENKIIKGSKKRSEINPNRDLLNKIKPRRKPSSPDRFAMVLRNLEKDLENPLTPKKKIPEVSKDNLIDRLTKSLVKSPIDYNPSKSSSMSERHLMINIIKRTMEPCWNFQAGSKKAEDIIVEIKVELQPDGKVRSARITNRNYLETDSFRLAAGESALRAVLNPSCQPYKLPVKKYEIWRDLQLIFNPREMLGR
jgi:hypothetical protein